VFFPLRWLLSRAAKYKAQRLRRRFERQTTTPREVQHQRLFEQIRRETPTAFGRDHGFSEVRTLEDFRRRIPISRYEYFQPYIERVRQGETEALFHRQRVRMFAMTSGTTAARKYIPVTDRFLADYRRGWNVWGIHIYESIPKLWFKGMLQLVGDWQEEKAPSGVPCGNISGLTSHVQMRIIRRLYVLPPESGKIKDVRTKYYLAWRLGLLRDVGLVFSANPSTIVNLAKFLDEERETIIRDLHDGTVDPKFALPPAVLQSVTKKLLPNRERAKELEALVAEHGRLLPRDVWPNLGVIGNWTGGSVGGYMRHYPEYYNPETPIRDLGLIASEGRMTIPVENGTPAGVLDIASAFFEFVPVGEIDSPSPVVLEAHELEEGRDYYILLTTSSGLYRYNIFDVVRCMGYRERTPMLAFLNKGSSFSNLTGEKLSEFQVVRAAEDAARASGTPLGVFSVAPCWDEETPYYGFFIEEKDFTSGEAKMRFLAQAEASLRKGNDEYIAKRDSHRLQPARLKLLPQGFWRTWDRERIAKTNGAPEQYKHPCLIPDVEFLKKTPVIGEQRLAEAVALG
jgi:hypothetical protein